MAPPARESPAIELRPAALHAMARCVARCHPLPAFRLVRAHLGRQRPAEKPRVGPARLFRCDLGGDACLWSAAMAATRRDLLYSVRALQPFCALGGRRRRQGHTLVLAPLRRRPAIPRARVTSAHLLRAAATGDGYLRWHTRDAELGGPRHVDRTPWR